MDQNKKEKLKNKICIKNKKIKILLNHHKMKFV
jgi:hypothetical protein